MGKKKNKKNTKKDKVKKTTTNKRKRTNKKEKKAFTLIELLAVIIILGVLMIIAIPAVTEYINNSRKSGYIDTAKNIISGARSKVNQGTLGMYDTSATYYIPAKMIETENGTRTPYGDFTQAYIGVVYDGRGYKYYWISNDTSRQGIKDVTPQDKLDESLIEGDLNDTDIRTTVETTGILGRSRILILGEDGKWEAERSAIAFVGENGGSSSGTENIPDPVSFSTDSWSTISNAIKNDNTDSYNVGDTKNIDLGDFGIHEVRIANKTKCTDSSMSESSCGFIIEFTEFVTSQKMCNSSFTNSNANPGGWANSDLRTYINNDVYNALPNDLKNVIISTKVISGQCKNVSNNLTSNDKLYLFSEKELGIDSTSDLSKAKTRTVDYYLTHTNGQDRYKKRNDDDYWMRTCRYSSTQNEFTIIYSGWDYYRSCTSTYGVTPSFRIG